jgi:hypothetical protein
VIQRTRSAGTVSRIDEHSGQLMPGVHLSYVPVGVAVGGDHAQAWILAVDSPASTSSVLLKLDSGQLSTVKRAIPGAPGCVDYSDIICNPSLGGGSIWVPVDSTVYRIEGSGQRQDKVTFADPIEDITYGHGALWVLSGTSLIRIDASDGSKGQPLDLTDRLGPDAIPRQLALAGEQLWIRFVVSTAAEGGLARVPVSTPALGVTTVVRFTRASSIASDGSSLWAATSEDPAHVTQVDIRTGEPIGTSLAVGGRAAWLAAVPPDLWLITRRGDSSRQLLHVVPPSAG